MSKIYFFRHAQASLGAVNYDVLSPKGELQAFELGKYLTDKKFQFDKIYVGPLRRQQHTYEIVKDVFDKKKLEMPDPIILDGLKEHRGTTAMKMVMPELIETIPYIKKLWEEGEANPARKNINLMRCFQYFINEWAEGNIKVDGVLSWSDFRRDVKKSLEKILQDTGKSETIAAFTSGGTISTITAESLNMIDQKRVAAMNFSVRNTSFTSFFFSGDQFNLLGFNELPHLPDDMITFV